MHIPVLENEVINYLSPRPGENFIDGTCGGAGHTIEILKRGGKVLSMDLDMAALTKAKGRIALENPSLLDNLILVHDNFTNIAKAAREYNFFPVKGILADLGMSSDQLEGSGRGFSFLKDEPLDMRFNDKQDLTAREIVNHWPQNEIEKILKDWGEERFSKNISRQIINSRKLKSILTTKELVTVIAAAVPIKYQHARIHFATRVFQALRIAVNDELGSLERFLHEALNLLDKEGRLAIISFHSLEDRIVKNFLRQAKQEGKLEILTKKPIIASAQEELKNPRSRSAKLRAAKKI
jgi:16S rRNA (cytosine1402-N4)-methyltransferase